MDLRFWRGPSHDMNAAEPAERRAAIQADQVGQNALRRLAQTDADASVREAAVKRLLDLIVLRRVLETDAERRVQEAARVRYRQLLAGGDTLALRYRLAALAVCADAQILAHVARSAREERLRLAALERISDCRLIDEIITHDLSPAVVAKAKARREALGR